MKTEQQLIDHLLELQEHPEQLTDEQLQQALDTPQMHELTEQMAFAKRAFKNKELQAEEPDVEREWEKFATQHFNVKDDPRRSSFFRKIAASIIGVFLISGIAFATIHIVRMVNNRLTQIAYTEQVESVNSSALRPAAEATTDTVAASQSIIFDNVPLEKMLTEIAAYYHASVTFQNDDARKLRFHFVWKREDGLGHAIEKLNRFESLSIRLEENKIIVE